MGYRIVAFKLAILLLVSAVSCEEANDLLDELADQIADETSYGDETRVNTRVTNPNPGVQGTADYPDPEDQQRFQRQGAVYSEGNPSSLIYAGRDGQGQQAIPQGAAGIDPNQLLLLQGGAGGPIGPGVFPGLIGHPGFSGQAFGSPLVPQGPIYAQGYPQGYPLPFPGGQGQFLGAFPGAEHPGAVGQLLIDPSGQQGIPLSPQSQQQALYLNPAAVGQQGQQGVAPGSAQQLQQLQGQGVILAVDPQQQQAVLVNQGSGQQQANRQAVLLNSAQGQQLIQRYAHLLGGNNAQAQQLLQRYAQQLSARQPINQHQLTQVGNVNYHRFLQSSATTPATFPTRTSAAQQQQQQQQQGLIPVQGSTQQFEQVAPFIPSAQITDPQAGFASVSYHGRLFSNSGRNSNRNARLNLRHTVNTPNTTQGSSQTNRHINNNNQYQ